MQYHPKSSAECYVFSYSWWAPAKASVLMAEGIYGIPSHSADICSGEPLVANTTRRMAQLTVDTLVYGAVRLRINHSNRSQ